MPIITKITRQKKRTDRYNIYLDDKYAFSVDETVLIEKRLSKGKVIEDFELDEISYEDEIRQAFNKALHFLSFRMRSEKEVKDKLAALDYPEAVQLEVIQKLKSLAFLNDESFSKALLETEKNSSKKGPRAIRQSLRKKGIDKNMQDEVLDSYTEEDQVKIAQTIAEKLQRQHNAKTPLQQKQKIQDALLRKGYNFQIIERAIQDISFEKEVDEWEDAVAKQGEKIWDKVNRKYSGRERAMRVKQALYQKGFPNDLITQFIEDKEQQEHDE